MANELSTSDKSEYKTHEKTIEKGIQYFKDVGDALFAIRDKKLYREDYKTFEIYCQHRWKLSKTRANQFIESAAVIDNLTTNGCQNNTQCTEKIEPKNERQARPLAKLPAEKQPEAWKKAVESAGGKQPTAKQVEEAVEDLEIPEPSKPPKPVEPKSPLQTAVELHKPTRDISARIHQIVRDFEAITEAHPHISTQSVTNHLKAAVAEIRLGQPYGVCGYCKGRKCRTCNNSGILNRVLFEQSPKEMQAGMETV